MGRRGVPSPSAIHASHFARVMPDSPCSGSMTAGVEADLSDSSVSDGVSVFSAGALWTDVDGEGKIPWSAVSWVDFSYVGPAMGGILLEQKEEGEKGSACGGVGEKGLDKGHHYRGSPQSTSIVCVHHNHILSTTRRG